MNSTKIRILMILFILLNMFSFTIIYNPLSAKEVTKDSKDTKETPKNKPKKIDKDDQKNNNVIPETETDKTNKEDKKPSGNVNIDLERSKDTKVPEVIKGLAEENAKSNADSDKKQVADEFEYSIENFILRTLIVIAILCLGGYLIFRWLQKKKKVSSNTELINKLGNVSLAPNKYIQIVEIANKIYILGVGDDIHLISEISNKEDIDLIKVLVSSESENSSFKDHLSKFIDKLQKNKTKDTSSNEDFENQHIENIKEKSDKLKNIK